MSDCSSKPGGIFKPPSTSPLAPPTSEEPTAVELTNVEPVELPTRPQETDGVFEDPEILTTTTTTTPKPISIFLKRVTLGVRWPAKDRMADTICAASSAGASAAPGLIFQASTLKCPATTIG
ncbi:unnamed protein product [Nesidiocoris tenuis]|uniref:Uncharacterized protein n=1 Tax=Nesidiocoris tenuis TaxID=355587 RepID=A0A6H5HQ72_9HEMI|nr:unnamed protein product [Nesidiocoris tenuis]